MAWAHDGWMLLPDLTDRHAELLLHIREVAQVLSGPSDQGAMDQHLKRDMPSVLKYFDGLKAERSDLEDALDIGIRQLNNDPFVSARPSPNSQR
jgi:hypothetical protein